MALFALLAGIGTVVTGSTPLTAVVLALLGLLAAVVLHYYRHENAVQRWYRRGRRLERGLGHLPPGSSPGSWG